MKTIYVKEIGRNLVSGSSEKIKEIVNGRELCEKESKARRNGVYTFGLCAVCALMLVGSVLANRDTAEEKVEFENVNQEISGILQDSAAEGLLSAAEVSENGEMLQETAALLEETQNWGLGFGKEGERPTGNASSAELAKYNAYFCAETEEKILYLTFDCGFENGNTEAILDALKKHNVTATFFVVGHYLESAPELVKRMVNEGHIVANHTYHHPDMSKISDKAAFQKEMDAVSVLYKEITGQDMEMYYRPPQGKYNLQNLQMAKELGYHTFFWSLAYVDWNQDSQPSHEEALSKLTGRVHPGAIVLLHNTSKTNGEIMDEILTKWEEMGYSFGPLKDLTNTEKVTNEKENTTGKIMQDGNSVNQA